MEDGAAVEFLLAYDPHLVKEVWWMIQGCYKNATNWPPPTSRISIAMITVYQVSLYTRVLHLVQNTPVGIYPFSIDESPPKGDDIE